MRLTKKDASDAPHGCQRPVRWTMRLAVLAVALLLLLPSWTSAWAAMAVPSLSPYLALATAIATRCVTWTTLLALPILGLAMLRPRWFCRYGCPTGLLLELAGRLRGRAGGRSARWPALGPWLFLVTVGGACIGYPLLVWLDPLAVFTGFINIAARATDRAEWPAAVGLPALLLVSVLWPGAWCRQVCPLGAMQDLVTVTRRKLRPHGRLRPTVRPGWTIVRRTALGVGLGAMGAGLAHVLIGARRKVLRPPGAVDEAAFTGLCVRCGNCARVCPSRIIHPTLVDGIDSLFTPTIRYDTAYCLESCQRCTDVCPSGALRRLTVREKRTAAIGLPRVDMSICLLGDDRECSLCRTHCPYDAIRIVFSEADYLSAPQVDPGRCNGCGACQVMCPTVPVKAIVIEPQALPSR
jgi:ferredoxin-type protein NapF